MKVFYFLASYLQNGSSALEYIMTKYQIKNEHLIEFSKSHRGLEVDVHLKVFCDPDSVILDYTNVGYFNIYGNFIKDINAAKDILLKLQEKISKEKDQSQSAEVKQSLFYIMWEIDKILRLFN